MSIFNELKNMLDAATTYPSREAYLAHLQEQWTERPSDPDLEGFLRLQGADAQLETPENPARQARRALMLKAQARWNEIFLSNAYDPDFQHDFLPNGEHLSRGLKALLEDCPTENSRARNAEALPIILGDDKEEKTALVIRRMHEARSILQEAMTMDDTQIVEHFAQIRNATRLVFDIHYIAGDKKHLNMDGELTDLLEEINFRFLPMATVLQERLQLIANPLYEILNSEQQHICRYDLAMDVLSETPQAQMLMQNNHFTEFTQRVFNFEMSLESFQKRDHWNILEDYFAANYAHPEDIQLFSIEDGHSLGNGSFMATSALRAGKAVAARLPGGELRVFSAAKDEDGQMSIGVDTWEDLFNTDLEEELQTLTADLEVADPWSTPSSGKFKAMKRAFQDLREDLQPLKDIPSPEEYGSLCQKLEALQDTAAAYLDYKGKGPHKKGVETQRVALGKKMKELAVRKLAQLKLTRDLQEQELRLQTIAGNDDFERQLSVLTGYTEMERELGRAGLRRGSKEAGLYYDTRFCAEGINEDVNRWYFADHFQPEDAAYARHHMARLVSLELLARERAANRPGETGSLEQALNRMEDTDEFVNGIEHSNIFQDLTRNLTPKSFAGFCANHGARDYADRLLARLQSAKPQKEQAQARQAQEEQAQAQPRQAR